VSEGENSVPWIHKEHKIHQQPELYAVEFVQTRPGIAIGDIRGYRINIAARLTHGMTRDDLPDEPKKWPAAVIVNKERFEKGIRKSKEARNTITAAANQRVKEAEEKASKAHRIAIAARNAMNDAIKAKKAAR